MIGGFASKDQGSVTSRDPPIHPPFADDLRCRQISSSHSPESMFVARFSSHSSPWHASCLDPFHGLPEANKGELRSLPVPMPPFLSSSHSPSGESTRCSWIRGHFLFLEAGISFCFFFPTHFFVLAIYTFGESFAAYIPGGGLYPRVAASLTCTTNTSSGPC